jgi:hypothetical protein
LERGSFEEVIEAVTSYWLSRCVHVVAAVGVADALGEEPQTPSSLASKVDANPDALDRVLRLMSAHGIFESRGDGCYVHNEASRLLRSDHPQSLRAYARFLGSPAVWQSWGALEHSVRSGEKAVDTVVPGGLFAWFADHPVDAEVFDQAMAGKAQGQVPAILACYDFSPFKLIADVGGGRGHLLVAVLDAAPGARGVLFDLPHVIGDAQGIASERLELQAGDFFLDALPTCDAYLLLEVIHDWADEEATAILAAVRDAAAPGAKLLVIERLVPSGPYPHPSKGMDVNMLVLTGGRERTHREYEALLTAAGLRLARVIETPGGVSIIEATAA